MTRKLEFRERFPLNNSSKQIFYVLRSESAGKGKADIAQKREGGELCL